MYELIFRNWKVAALWAIGISCSAAAYLEEGGGKDKLEASAQQIRAQHQAQAVPQPAPQPAASADDSGDEFSETAAIAPVDTSNPDAVAPEPGEGDGRDGNTDSVPSDPANG